ncbi:cyclic nucleotide-binding domain-containing protein [bacterium]|nr:cyclic nucleotide-binding domain-containing protein [bacterium]
MIHSIAFLAAMVGLFSAISLPIGSIIGLTTHPKEKITSALMAFGGGALLFALTIEIIAHSFHEVGFLPVAIGAVTGGILYEILNHGLNKIGAFFRKTTTVGRYITNKKMKRARRIIESLSQVEILNSLPPDDIATLVPDIHEVFFPIGKLICKEKSAGDCFYLIESGKVKVSRDNELIAELSEGDAFGEMSMLTGADRSATVTAVEDTKLFRIFKSDFDKLMMLSPEVSKAVQELLIKRSKELEEKKLIPKDVAMNWRRETSKFLDRNDFKATRNDIDDEAKSHGNAALGIWLGIMLDGIPESLVIGIAIVSKNSIPWALIAGVFLANLPEAMSSSVVMKKQNYSFKKIMIMWTSITIMTGLGALIGNLFFQGVSPVGVGLIEGIAAGAMLTMLAETMLPEAYEQGGAVVGLSTLAGFLAALFIKSLS